MKAPKGMLDKIKTRGDFRRVSESVQQQSEDGQKRRERLADVWAQIADAYGSAFTSQFGEEPNQTWSDGLSPYDVSEVLKAVGNVINAGGEYAPNLATILKELNVVKAPNQHLMARSLEDIRNTPILNLGESINVLDSPEGMKASDLGTPEDNPDYFKNLMNRGE